MGNRMPKDSAAPKGVWTPETHMVWAATRPRVGDALTTDEWVWLNPNDRVKVQRGNGPIAAGFIDVVAPDASIFWIWLDDGRGRVALHMGDIVSVWLEKRA